MSTPTTDTIPEVSPEATAEAVTAGITATFGRVLELDDVGSGDDFFAVGGDSLLATRVLSAIAREYDVELTFDEFVLAATPAALARLITPRITGARP